MARLGLRSNWIGRPKDIPPAIAFGRKRLLGARKLPALVGQFSSECEAFATTRLVDPMLKCRDQLCNSESPASWRTTAPFNHGRVG